jgi:hypothetical protein
MFLKFTCKGQLLEVEPRGVDPLTSAVQSQGLIVVDVRRCSRGLVYCWCTGSHLI